MRKLLIALLFMPLYLLANVDADVENMELYGMLWLGGTLLIVVLFFWGIYKAMKTRNAKYGYFIFFMLFLLFGTLYI